MASSGQRSETPRTPSRTPSGKHTYSIFPPTPRTANSQLSPSSLASKSSQNTTGTGIHHKSYSSKAIAESAEPIDPQGKSAGTIVEEQGTKPDSGAQAGVSKFRSDENAMKMRSKEGGPSGTREKINAYRSKMQKPREDMEGDKLSSVSKAQKSYEVHMGPSGYNKGQYVTKLGSSEENAGIHATVTKAKKKQRPWWKRLLGIGKK